tara:strand:- start:207 stop:656 length:450 start_codon:yes stop_codon:yes gene_type:complete
MAKGTLNKVFLVGRLGKDPEIRFSGDGNAIANFSIATNETWKNKEGNQQEKTDWHNIVVFGASAEKYIQPYVKKGTLVSVEGKLQTRDWEDKDGNKRYTTEVIADLYGGVQILGSGGGENSLDSSSGMNQDPVKKENPDQTVEDDDLPF